MNLYIDLNNNLKLLNIQKNISCFSLKNIIINKYSLKYDFSIIYKNKILENNDLINSNKDIYKIITAVLIALFPIHPVFTLYFDWPVILKCVLILICLGFRKYYVFEFKKQLVQVRFLGLKLNDTNLE